MAKQETIRAHQENILLMKNIIYILALSIVSLYSCRSTKKIEETSKIEVSSLVDQLNSLKETKIKTVENIKDTVYAASKESFTIKPDSTGKIIPFNKTFNKGDVYGSYGYDEKNGFYININKKKTSSRIIEKLKDSTSRKDTDHKKNIDTKKFFNQTKETVKGWGIITWIKNLSPIFLIVLLLWKIKKKWNPFLFILNKLKK